MICNPQQFWDEAESLMREIMAVGYAIRRAVVQVIAGVGLFVIIFSRVTIIFSIQPSKLKVLPASFWGSPLAKKKRISSVTNLCAECSGSDTQFFAVAQNWCLTVNISHRWSSPLLSW